ncbi:hypothetical protein TRAPUB_9228 [Trametes pubescens]|uniref:Uncharacterized protein n=1 Tax=Trametes pubescens TaxID=154538 RepID=A0A1M2W2N1_TRAPU|nr:hypothetical protein TRAPUB_9228 [Trametes pubescens]
MSKPRNVGMVQTAGVGTKLLRTSMVTALLCFGLAGFLGHVDRDGTLGTRPHLTPTSPRRFRSLLILVGSLGDPSVPPPSCGPREGLMLDRARKGLAAEVGIHGMF